MSAFDLRGLLAALDEHGVRFVAIGGVAVAAHGYVRATRDLDIVPKFNPENVERLAQALGEDVERIEGAGHLANAEQPAAFNSAIDRFLHQSE
mgnify:CR=1 FL=1